MTTGKIIGIAILAITEAVIVYGLTLEGHFALCASLQAGVFGAVWSAISISGYQKRKNGNSITAYKKIPIGEQEQYR